MISGFSHVTFAVSNLDKSLDFYIQLLGLKPVVRWSDGAYLVAEEFWVALILDPRAPEAVMQTSYTHLAFSVSPEDFSTLRNKLLTQGIEEWQPNTSFGESFYFCDPDGHKLEIHARSLSDRVAWLRKNPKHEMLWFE